MGMGMGDLLLSFIFLTNAVCVLHDKRFLAGADGSSLPALNFGELIKYENGHVVAGGKLPMGVAQGVYSLKLMMRSTGVLLLLNTLTIVYQVLFG